MAIAAELAVIAALSALIVSVWNSVVPSSMQGPALNFWQAAGLVLLAHVLFRKKPLYGTRAWQLARRRRQLRQRLASMTAEERAAFRMELGLSKPDTMRGS
jgi:hypothetical protein